jgi:hypothetical protein
VSAVPAVEDDMADGLVRLAASHRLRSHPESVLRLLRGDGLAWARMADPGPGLRRFAVDLRLRIGGPDRGLTTFGKAAYVDLGMPVRTVEGWVVDVGWRASSGAPLFPVFAGQLHVRRDELRIEGLYAPPGGAIGRAADRALLHLAANATARWLLGELDRIAAG